MRATRFSLGAVLAAALLLALPCDVRASNPTTPTTPSAIEVDTSPKGVTVVASGARIEDVLSALAEKEGFAVSLQSGLDRPPVDVEVRNASLEEVLHRVLEQRNYTIGYERTANGFAVKRVELLLPRPPQQAVAAAMRRMRPQQVTRRTLPQQRVLTGNRIAPQPLRRLR